MFRKPENKASIRTVFCLTLLLLLLPCTCVRAQENPTETEVPDGIVMMARSLGDSVRLRWAPTNFRIWQNSREAGLFIERFTLRRNGQMLPLAQRSAGTRLNLEPIRPSAEAAFGALAEEDRYVAIGGQAIYGKTFSTGSSEADDAAFGGILNRAREQSNRFSFGLHAADQSWTAATMMGLAFTDNTAKPNEVYLYKLVPAAPISGFDTDRSGYVTVVVNDNAEAPPVRDLAVEFRDGMAVLSWDLELAATHYASYFILRSPDGINWAKVNHDGLPFVPLLKPGQAPTAFYQDSLPQNNTPFFFQVIGWTPFGTMGEASDPVQGMGLDPKPSSSPTLTSVFSTNEGGLVISWMFPEGQKINGFKVERARSDGGDYEAVSPLLGPATRDFTDADPLPTNYYRVTVFDQYDRPLSSFSSLAQLEDEMAPEVPAGLRGLILKDGRVIISWDANQEADLLGYRIWLSNQPEAEYSLATGAPIMENHFVGQTTLNTLSPKLYAKIVSLDYRHNTSEFSDFIELVRPDTLPPAPALLTDIRANSDSCTIQWAFSKSLDVATHQLERRALEGVDTSWATVATFAAPLTADFGTHTDTELAKGSTYAYRMIAEDLGGLQATSNSMVGGIIDDFIRRGIEKVSASVDRREKTVNLRWGYEAERDNFKHFEIWRAKPDKAPVAIATVVPEVAAGNKRKPVFSYVDASPLRMNTTYVYHLKAVYEDGAESALSAPVAVEF